MKSYTDINQSKKLAEILPRESADMGYIPSAEDDDGNTLYTAEFKSEFIFDEDSCIPCWSLAALIGLIPKFSLEKDISNNAGFQLHYNYNTTYYDEPVDAAFEMICWLKEYGKI